MNLQRQRRKTANRVFGCRADDELAEWVESYCYEEEITESQLLVRALRLYRRTVEKAAESGVKLAVETPKDRQRQRDEALLYQIRLCNRYLYQLVADCYGAGQVEADSAEVKREVAEEVREIFQAIDEGEEG